MKKIYVMALLVLPLVASSQELVTVNKVKPTKTKDFKMYPNPSYGEEVYITTSSNGEKDIKIYNVFGEVVLTDKITTSTLDISRLSPGVYDLQVTEDKKTMTRKLVIK